MKNIKTKYWLIGAIVLVFGLFWWARSINTVNEVPPTIDFPVPAIDAITEYDQIKGSTSTSAVLIVEYSDFQCPACKAYAPLVKEFMASSSDVTFVYRHFPLTQHFNAKKAAIAAEAAGLQGKFFEMHDLLFEQQDSWGSAVNPNKMFVGYAESIGLDADKFEADLSSGDLRLKVDQDLKSGQQVGVSGTPSFYVNGSKIDSPKSVADFEAIVNSFKQQDS